jgi:winged helix domain-containing protein
VTRKRPTCDLALRLFCAGAEERWERRCHFTPEASLFRNGLLQWLPENADAPALSLARSFHAPLRIVDFLLGTSSSEQKLAAFAQLLEPRQRWEELVLPEALIADLRGAIRLITDPSPRYSFLKAVQALANSHVPRRFVRRWGDRCCGRRCRR